MRVPSRGQAEVTAAEAFRSSVLHLAKRGFDDVKVVVSGGYGPNQTDEKAALIEAQKRTLDGAAIPYNLNVRNAGSWPGVVFNGAPLNLPTGQFGLSRGGGAHAPNEWYLIRSANPKVGGIDEASLLFADLFYEVAKIGSRK